MSSLPTIGSLSLDLTFLFSATFFVPAGAISGARGLPVGFCTVVPGGMFFGVPANTALGRSNLTSAMPASSFLSCAVTTAPPQSTSPTNDVPAARPNHFNPRWIMFIAPLMENQTRQSTERIPPRPRPGPARSPALYQDGETSLNVSRRTVPDNLPWPTPSGVGARMTSDRQPAQP